MTCILSLQTRRVVLGSLFNTGGQLIHHPSTSGEHGDEQSEAVDKRHIYGDNAGLLKAFITTMGITYPQVMGLSEPQPLAFQAHFCTFSSGCPQFCPIYPRSERVTTFFRTCSRSLISSFKNLPTLGVAVGTMECVSTTREEKRSLKRLLVDSVENSSTAFVEKQATYPPNILDVENSSTMIVEKWLFVRSPGG